MTATRLVAVAAAILLGARLAQAIFGHGASARGHRSVSRRTAPGLPAVNARGTIAARRVAPRAGMTRQTEARGLDMSEHNPQFESVDSAADAEASGSFSGNGTQPDDSAVAVSDAAPESVADAVAVDGETTEAAAAEADAAVEAAAEADSQPVAEGDAQISAEGDVAPTAGPSAPPADDDGSAFLAALAQAMQATAGSERAKIADDTNSRRETHIAAIQARRDAEASRMRELADDDRKTIDAWADAERQHIQLEHERRSQALQRDLEASLATHSSKIDQEIDRVEAAIASYRAEVDLFFTTLEGETDPIAIAQQAGRRPAFPDLAVASASAPDATPAGTSTVGVMDPEASATNAGPWPSWTQTPDATAPAETLVAPDPSAADGSSPEPAVLSAVANGEETGGSIVQSMPVSRPMSWLRRDRESAENANKDK